ncbi:Toluene efflux pump ttgABC operon repressor (plasmid) [Tsukamurella tyrosinosolvens]|uniref:DNA-binding transcriptional regulator, AcrR family n=2 Tax=Tsukamurella tyrosinosolvens TaxID=57704 RepID=A0A1H4SJW4_TSUTY|nr:DNA-binding transcriptional regulator, AcrR family [Tsukamurella tyrosinosolvens]VEH96459.1 Toluene efflux pump ttgABC operon repressor [Tsukamurella tyrosinosolvens]
MVIGRPRGFDDEEVLSAAERVFWEKGFDGTTLADLREATGLNPGSLYGAFGSKAGLFARVVEHYRQTVAGYIPAALEKESFNEVVRALLEGVIRAATDERTPPGCLLVHSSLSSSGIPDEMRKEIRLQRAGIQSSISERAREAQAKGELSGAVSADGVAAYTLVLSNGLAAAASSGIETRALKEVIELALGRLPWDHA